MKRISVAGALLALAGCSTSHSDGAPDVDWSGIPRYQQTAITNAVGAQDCSRMQDLFDASSHADVLAYLDWHMENSGCYR